MIRPLGKDGSSKTDEFLEKFQKGGGVISNPKIYVADFCHYKRFLGHVFRKKSATWFSENEGGGIKGRLELFQKFIRFGSAALP